MHEKTNSGLVLATRVRLSTTRKILCRNDKPVRGRYDLQVRFNQLAGAAVGACKLHCGFTGVRRIDCEILVVRTLMLTIEVTNLL